MISAPDKAPDRIASMFDAIAPRYDLLNSVLSAGIDRRWRARAIRSLQLTGRETLLDVCTGTADVALEGRVAARVLGVDFAAAMLARGLRKVRAAGQSGRVALVRGDAMRLPVPDSCVDAVTIAFGIHSLRRIAERRGLRILRFGRNLRRHGQAIRVRQRRTLARLKCLQVKPRFHEHEGPVEVVLTLDPPLLHLLWRQEKQRNLRPVNERRNYQCVEHDRENDPVAAVNGMADDVLVLVAIVEVEMNQRCERRL